LKAWGKKGSKPSDTTVSAGCEQAKARLGSTCKARVGYGLAPLESRVQAR